MAQIKETKVQDNTMAKIKETKEQTTQWPKKKEKNNDQCTKNVLTFQ
jgi:hypothetical protein